MFGYRNGQLAADGIALQAIAPSVGTPFYGYSHAALDAAALDYAGAFGAVGIDCYYAVKANSNLAVIAALARRGFGADIVSGGELTRALAGGIPASRIVYSGVGKSEAELLAALEAGIHQINIESEPELRQLIRITAATGLPCAAALRVNPDIEAGAHHKISTGRATDKFGVAMDRAAGLFAMARGTGVALTGLAMHIGSQIVTLDPFRQAYARLDALASELRATGFIIDRLDLGGGFGVTYEDETPPAASDFAALARQAFPGFTGRIGVEPGRALVANAGVLVTRVLCVKRAEGRVFVVVDAGMNDLIRPALYEAVHRIIPLRQPAPDAGTLLCDIVGPVCETGDIFAADRVLPGDVSAGDYLAILSAGAYGSSMASTYNTRPLIPEVMMHDSAYEIVRRRVSVEEMMAFESVPGWLA